MIWRRLGTVALVSALSLAGAGCLLRQPGPYVLRRTAGLALLYPPRYDAAAQPVTFGLRLGGGAACRGLAGSYRNPALGLQWSLAQRKLAVTLAPAITQFGTRLPVELLQGFQDLHRSLDQAVSLRCLAPARKAALLRRLTEGLPMAPGLAQAILLGPFTTQKFVDVAAPVELDLTYATHPDQPGRYDLGYVDSLYRLVADDAVGRGHLALVRRRVHRAAAGEPLPPLPLALAAPRLPSYFRMFFHLRKSRSNHDVALLVAANRAALERATQVLLSKPNQCDQLAGSDAQCLQAPPEVGLEARLAITLQGRNATVALPATVDQALIAAGVHDPADVLPTLRVERPYGAGWAQVVAAGPPRDLLDLTLSGGERIVW
ncbi:MAG TPA: hypothetical protein VNF74_02395 [Terriglobales bacterium]|nr:hypothetical protein [Terriglobales bacterium]